MSDIPERSYSERKEGQPLDVVHGCIEQLTQEVLRDLHLMFSGASGQLHGEAVLVGFPCGRRFKATIVCEWVGPS